VPGHPDAHQRHTDAATDRDGDDGQGDRDAQPPRDHLVEQRVAGVLVPGAVAGEAQIHEQVRQQGIEGGCGAARREVVETGELGRHIESGSGVGRHQQRRLVEGDLLGWPGEQLGEALGRVHRRSVPVARSALAVPGHGRATVPSTSIQGERR
jgi:hypothetical protein